jgi:hypothetical protein
MCTNYIVTWVSWITAASFGSTFDWLVLAERCSTLGCRTNVGYALRSCLNEILR